MAASKEGYETPEGVRAERARSGANGRLNPGPPADCYTNDIDLTLKRSGDELKVKERDRVPLEECIIDFSELKLGEVIGRGVFGEVRKATLWESTVAVKEIIGWVQDPKIKAEFEQEVSVLKALRHPNCVLFLGYTKPPFMSIVTEFMSRGSLSGLIHDPAVRLDHRHVLTVAISVARGMAYLHSRGILHKDLKSNNVLVHGDFVSVKVADFGLASLEGHTSNYCGTVQWRAPEVTASHYLPASDVYSYGVLLWELVSRKVPWEGVDITTVRAAVRDGARPPLPEACPSRLRNLIEMCWAQDPAKRPTFAQILAELSPFAVMLGDVDSDSTTGPSEAAEPPRKGSLNIDKVVDADSAKRTFHLVKENSLYSMLPEKIMYGRMWSSMIRSTRLDDGIAAIQSLVFPLVETLCRGCFCMLDRHYGKTLCLFVYHSHEAIRKADEVASANPHIVAKLSELACAPFLRESYEVASFGFDPPTAGSPPRTARCALVVRTTQNVGAQSSPLSLFEEKVAGLLRLTCPGWVGSLVLANLESGKVILVNCFEEWEALLAVERGGLVQQVLTFFQYHLAEIPVMEKMEIDLGMWRLANPVVGAAAAPTDAEYICHPQRIHRERMDRQRAQEEAQKREKEELESLRREVQELRAEIARLRQRGHK